MRVTVAPANNGQPSPIPVNIPVAAVPVIVKQQQSEKLLPIPSRARAALAASYQYDKRIRQVVITLVSADTGEVVVELPPEKVLDLEAALLNTVKQMLDSKA